MVFRHVYGVGNLRGIVKGGKIYIACKFEHAPTNATDLSFMHFSVRADNRIVYNPIIRPSYTIRLIPREYILRHLDTTKHVMPRFQEYCISKKFFILGISE